MQILALYAECKNKQDIFPFWQLIRYKRRPIRKMTIYVVNAVIGSKGRRSGWTEEGREMMKKGKVLNVILQKME